jgi:Glycosyltransferase family 87
MNNRKRLAIIAASIIFTAAIGVLVVNRHKFIDFPVYYLAGESLLAGRTNLYSPEFSGGTLMDYRYPPFFLVVFGWLALFPYIWAAYIWYWLCVLEIAGCVFCAGRAVNLHFFSAPPGKKVIFWLLALLITGQYFVVAFHFGNAHLLMTFLLFASLYLSLKRRDGWAGALISIAITIKILPLLVLPYFVLKRRWKYLIYAGIFLVVLNLLPALYFGFGKNSELLETWADHVVFNQDSHEENSQVNLSLKGQMRRYLTQIDYSRRAAGTENTDTDYRNVNLAALQPDSVNRFWIILACLLYASLFAFIWLRSRGNIGTGVETGGENDVQSILSLPEREVLELALVICVILVVGPNSPKVYFIELLWPVAALSRFALTRTDLAATICKGILAVLAMTNLVLPLLPGRSIQRLLLVEGVDFYVAMFLLAGVAIALLSGPGHAYLRGPIREE